MGPQTSAQARLRRGKGDWDSWLIRAGLRLRLGRVKGAACRLPGNSFLNSAVCWAPPMVLSSSPPIFTAVASPLGKQRLLWQRLSSSLQKVVTFKFSAWSFRESTGKQMLFLGGTCHLRRVVPPGGWALQASSQRKGAGLQEEGERKCLKRNEGTCSHLPLRYSWDWCRKP